MVHRDVVSGGVLLGVSVAYFTATRTMPAGQGEPGPAFIPVVLAVSLFLLGLATLGGGWLSARAPEGPVRDPEGGSNGDSAVGVPPTAPHQAWQAVGLTVLYVVLFQPLGFALSTLAYTFGVTALFPRRDARMLFLVPPLCTLAVYLFFRVGLGARLPGGPFG